MNAKHTPGPWTFHKGRANSTMGAPMEYEVRGPNVCAHLTGYAPELAARGEFIVRACNSHAELLAALSALVTSCTGVMGAGTVATPHPDKVAAARAAIARATEG